MHSCTHNNRACFQTYFQMVFIEYKNESRFNLMFHRPPTSGPSHHTLIWFSADPPPQAPVITRSPSSRPLYSTDDLTLICEVTGGKPLVTSVSLSCSSRHPDNPSDVTGSDSVSSSLQMTLTDDDDGITCSCTAVWKVTSFYTLSDSTTFTVYCELLVLYKYIL